MVSDAISCPLCDKYPLYIIMTLYSNVVQVLTTCPLMVSDAISYPLCNLNTLKYIIMTLYSYVEEVMKMCRIQERQLLLAYFLSYFPLIVYAAMLSFLNTHRINFMKLYSSVEDVTKCVVYTKYGSSHIHISRNYPLLSPPPPPPPRPAKKK